MVVVGARYENDKSVNKEGESGSRYCMGPNVLWHVK